MANNFVFVSPGVKFREVDLSFVTQSVGVTTLGLVGETTKGPAYQPVNIADQGSFNSTFGLQDVSKFPTGSLKYLLPYVANAYLQNSNQLYVTRLLGLSGYDAGHAWAVKVSSGVDLSTTGVTTTGTSVVSFSNFSYLGTTITNTGQTGTISTGFTQISVNPSRFSTLIRNFTVLTLLNNGTGTVNVNFKTITGSSISTYDNTVVAILRSRANITDNVGAAPTTTFTTTSLSISANNTNIGAGDVFGSFVLSAVGGSGSANYTVSLNPNAKNFISTVIGKAPKDKNTMIYVESIFEDLISKLDNDGILYSVSSTLINASTSTFTNYQQSYKTPETPWVVSELRGSSIDRLFKFVSISDGNTANQEIKISIQNIDPIQQQFDVIIRDFNDTDANIVPLESFLGCSMEQGLNNYVGRRIGTIDGEFPLQSKYVMLDIDPNAPNDAFPAGFEGYLYFDFAISATSASSAGVSPELFYKQTYLTSDKISKTYLGISERGYDGNNGLVGTGFDPQFFNYTGLDISSTNGVAPHGHIKTKGFHLDSGATGTYYDGTTFVGTFDVGADSFQTAVDVTNPNNIYSTPNAAKFTLVPYGGFDGWNEHRVTRSNGDLFAAGKPFSGVIGSATPTNDFQAWEMGLATFANPEQITINLFATPGLDFSNQLALVNEGINLVEQLRADSLYIIDAPDQPDSPTMAQDISDLLKSTGINSSYAATYYPWIQIADNTNNQNVYIPPTSEVVKAIAYNDNVAFPWYAPAGLQRGVTSAIRARRKLSLSDRDTLYAQSINPMATFPETGVAIFGQKTLQVADTSLNRINVRRLLLQLKVLISNIAIRTVFEQDDQTTIDNFLNKVNPILETVRREQGLEQFQVVMDDSNNTPETRDRNELYGNIQIIPIKSVEFIGLTFTISPSGASFSA